MKITISFNNQELVFVNKLLDNAVGMVVESDGLTHVLCLPIVSIVGKVKELIQQIESTGIEGMELKYVGKTTIIAYSKLNAVVPHIWYFYFDRFMPHIAVRSLSPHIKPSSKSAHMAGAALSNLNKASIANIKKMVTAAISATTTFDKNTCCFARKQIRPISLM